MEFDDVVNVRLVEAGLSRHDRVDLVWKTWAAMTKFLQYEHSYLGTALPSLGTYATACESSAMFTYRKLCFFFMVGLATHIVTGSHL